MDKETLSNYGWIVICVLVLAVMLAFATPFGTFIADGFKATYTGLFQTGDNALDVGLSAVGVSNKLPCGHGRKEAGDHSQKECGHYNCQDADCGCVPASCGVEGHWSGDGLDHTTAVNHTGHTYACQCVEGWTVPEGGTYYTGIKTLSVYVGDYSNATATYVSGEKLPDCYVPQKGDTFVYGDFEYRYKKIASEWTQSWGDNDYQTNWAARVIDQSKDEYGPILEYICGCPVTSLKAAFKNCTNLDIAGIPELPSTTTMLTYAFAGCTSLTTAPVIPNSVTSMGDIFENCKSLKTYEGSTDSDGDFSNYIIPESVIDMPYAFQNCTGIVTAPTIPSNVTNMYSTFQGCTNLAGTIIINANPTTYWTKCLYGTQITEVVGNTTMAEHLMLTKTSTANNPTP